MISMTDTMVPSPAATRAALEPTVPPPEDEDVAGGNPGHSGQQVRPGCLILVVANP